MSFNYAEKERTKDSAPVSATSKPVSRPDMIQNSDVGFGFATGPLKQLQRFLILGSESPTYYASAKELTESNCANIKGCIMNYPKETLDLILDVSETARAPKQNPTIFAFALFFKYAAPEWKFIASCQAHRILRTFTMLAMFMKYITMFQGGGRSIRRVAGNWYNLKTPDQVLYQYTKYGNREGWTHKDVLHYCHVRPEADELKVLLGHIFGKVSEEDLVKTFPKYQVDIDLRKAATERDVIKLINGAHRVQWEQLPTQWLKSENVWEALLPGLGATALLRVLGRLSSVGVTTGGMNDSLKFIVNRLTDPEALRKEKVHPFGILTAWNAYSKGRGFKGDLFWSPNTHVIAALEQAYLASSNNVPATGKNFLVGVDCSGSMLSGNICGVEGMTPAVASGCIALEIVKKEPWAEAKGFSNELFDLKMSKTSGLRDAIRAVSNGPVSSTNPGRLIEYAIARRLPVDVFMMITDNEVNHGKHPFMWLKQYRNQMGRNAKLVVIGMTATNITLADPSDGGMLDVVGFDSGAPSVIHDFVLGNL